jgi:SAM-dependent MidA family methyltransferase
MSSELDLRINAEIAEGGPISFSRFMERALTEPSLGYYVTERVRAGREGDFITAPELHSLLGSALARMATEVWRRVGEPARFRWVEYGAGSGALALALIAQLRRDKSPLINALEIQPIDVNIFRSEELRRAVTSEQQNGAPLLVSAGASPVAGLVVANEYLDALPFSIYVGRAAAAHGVSERCVGLAADGETRVWVERELDASEAQRVAEHFGASLTEGQLAEACYAFDAWLREAATRITSGLVAVIDYGRDGVTLRDAANRMAGTALAYQGHRATTDLMSEPGERDLTAHVDLTALRKAAAVAGLQPVASTSQAALLAGAGLDDEIDRLRRGPEATLEGAIALRSALAHLMNPRGMGGFAVELFALGTPEHRSRLADPTNPLPGATASIRPLV